MRRATLNICASLQPPILESEKGQGRQLYHNSPECLQKVLEHPQKSLDINGWKNSKVLLLFFFHRFLNRAMQSFDATVVVPTNFVLFTISAIISGE